MHSFHIYHYDPDIDAKPRMHAIEVEVGDSERMPLDALMKLKAIDPNLSFRRSCREGVCGSYGCALPHALKSALPTRPCFESYAHGLEVGVATPDRIEPHVRAGLHLVGLQH